jgi:simple sugar transport system substrate-binding protein
MSYEVKEVDPRDREVSRRRFLKRAGAAALAVPALSTVLEACGTSSPGTASAASFGANGKDPFGKHPNWTFALVNHVTTNPFFVPTRYGAQDACNLLGVSYTWTGSANSIVPHMVSAMNTAIADKVHGIGVPVIDPTAFIKPTDDALSEGIPVVAYNANPPANSKNNQMAYIGQDLFQAGVLAGNRILQFVSKGDLVGGMIATPGTANIQPRMDGAKSVLKPAGVDLVEVATGAQLSQEYSTVPSWYLGHKDVKFLYAVDDGSGEAVAQTITKYNLKGKVHGSGWDVAVPELKAIKAGSLDFSIDQQAYLQGFLPIVQLFLYQLSGGLMRPSNTDTGLLFVTTDNVDSYLNVPSRFEGSTTSEKVLTAPKSIQEVALQ